MWGTLAVGAALLALFVVAERRAESPVVQPAHLANRNLVLAGALSFSVGMVEAGMIFAPSFAMHALGYSSQKAGSMVSAVALAMVVATPLTGMLLDRVGARPVLVVSTLVTSAGHFIFSRVSSGPGFVAGLAIVGAGLAALLGAPLRYVVAAETDERDRASAQGLLSVFTSTGISLGASIAGALIASSTPQEPLSGYRRLYVAIAVVAALAWPLALGITNHRTKTVALRG